MRNTAPHHSYDVSFSLFFSLPFFLRSTPVAPTRDVTQGGGYVQRAKINLPHASQSASPGIAGCSNRFWKRNVREIGQPCLTYDGVNLELR